jgi:hypothetical protein
MDNRVDIPGYKYYVDPVSGDRPPLHVAFLDIEPGTDHKVNGVCVPVTSDQLRDLDRREQQYDRIDVREQFPMLAGPVWVYVGSALGRERRQTGDRSGTTVVTRDYRDRVVHGFDVLGERERLAYEASTSPCGCRVAELSQRAVTDAPNPDAWTIS